MYFTEVMTVVSISLSDSSQMILEKNVSALSEEKTQCAQYQKHHMVTPKFMKYQKVFKIKVQKFEVGAWLKCLLC